MNRTVEARLRKLEARTPAKRMRYVFWTTSDQAEWEGESAAIITIHRSWGAIGRDVTPGTCAQ